MLSFLNLNKKTFKNKYFIVLLVIIVLYISYMFYQNMDKFTNTRLLGGSKKQLILFYSPDCGHCERFLPTWNKFEYEFNGKKNVEIIKINGYSYPDLAKEYRIEGFPTVLYLKDGIIVKKYNGDRTLNSLVDFLHQI